MRRRTPVSQDDYYRGVRMVPYDLLKELVAVLVGTAIVIAVLAVAFSSPDIPAVTIQRWAQQDPVDFVTTATAELSGASTSAGYGAPYNSGSGAVQSWAFLKPQQWAGVHQPVDSVNQFVLLPLQQATAGDPTLAGALTTFTSTGGDQQTKWLDAYTKALRNASVENGAVSVVAGDYGPVPVLMGRLLGIARSGGLDGLLLTSGHLFQTDYTAPLLFLGDGSYFAGLAQDQKLTGSQWGVMNETGRYPGQAWLWLYTMWYQIAPYNRTADSGFLGISASNTDLAVVGTMGTLTLLLLFLPFIPGLRDIPRWIPIHRLIWRRYYAEESARATAG
jgi:hypothetical protein